jgi:hypothetical protein
MRYQLLCCVSIWQLCVRARDVSLRIHRFASLPWNILLVHGLSYHNSDKLTLSHHSPPNLSPLNLRSPQPTNKLSLSRTGNMSS